MSVACHIAYAKVPSSTNCHKHPIMCSITTLQPALAGTGEALLLSNLISKYSKKHNVDPYRLVAIAMQESSIKNINRQSNGIITDVGIYQFNVGTIDAFNLDFMRLQEDIAYATERAAWLLAVKLKECNDLGTDAWACFHSRSIKNRTKYKNLVNTYYNRIIKFKPLPLEELGQI